jgi:preprotein translocase subunit SecF
MFIVKHRKIFYTFSIVIIGIAVTALSFWGLSFGIDFKGGSSVEFGYAESRPSTEVVRAQIDDLSFEPSIQGLYSIVPAGTDGYVLKLRTVTEEERSLLISAISVNTANSVEIKKFSSVGPTLGKEAATKSLVSIILVILSIVVFLTFAFRKVSHPISSWKYGSISILTLLHDVIIPVGVFAILSHFYNGYEVDTLFVTAILVVLGFSIHDTIVVFDRVRENLYHRKSPVKTEEEFEEVVGTSISQVFVRSINTSLTTLFAVLVIYLIGPEATRNFSLTLFVGILVGAYSSIFIASNLLITFNKFQRRGSK